VCGGDAPSGSPPVTVDLDLHCRDGRTVPFAVTIKNLLDDPTVAALVVSGHDISDRRAAEHALRSANSVLAATLESTADGILVVDNSGNITSVNRRFVEMWRTPDDVLASRDNEQCIAAALDQVRDPDVFVAK